MFFFLKFPETERAEEEDQVALQAPEDPHDSSTDTCLSFPYSSNSPRPSPVHPVTDSPIRVSPLLIVTSNSSSNNSPTHRSTGHNSPTSALSTPPAPTSPQTPTSIPPIQTINPSNNSFHTPHFPSPPPHTGPTVPPGSLPEFPHPGVPFPGTSSTPSETVSPLPIPHLPWPLPPPNPNLSLPPSPSPQPAPGPTEGRAEDPGAPTLGGGGLPGAEEAEPPPPPAARPLPPPAQPPLVPPRGPLLVKPQTQPPHPEPLTILLSVLPQALRTTSTPLSQELLLLQQSPIAPLHSLRKASPLSIQPVSPMVMTPNLSWLQESTSKYYFF